MPFSWRLSVINVPTLALIIFFFGLILFSVGGFFVILSLDVLPRGREKIFVFLFLHDLYISLFLKKKALSYCVSDRKPFDQVISWSLSKLSAMLRFHPLLCALPKCSEQFKVRWEMSNVFSFFFFFFVCHASSWHCRETVILLLTRCRNRRL